MEMNLWEIYHGEIPGFLREVAETEVMQRLKHVGMNCGCEYTSFPLFQGCGPYSRFDHSMGTALIVWHFTVDRTQAMAGLLHDIATPVFAHVIDFLRGREKGSAPERLRESEVMRMLGTADQFAEATEAPENDFMVGETVKIIDSSCAFSGFSGVIEEVNKEKKKIKVSVKIFGRKTPMELDNAQVERE